MSWMSYLSGSGATELVFSYTVGTGDDDADGVWWNANSLRLDGNDSITGAYNGLNAVLDHSELGKLDRSSHRPEPAGDLAGGDLRSHRRHGLGHLRGRTTRSPSRWCSTRR